MFHCPASCAHLCHVGVPHGHSILPGQAAVHVKHHFVCCGACTALLVIPVMS